MWLPSVLMVFTMERADGLDMARVVAALKDWWDRVLKQKLDLVVFFYSDQAILDKKAKSRGGMVLEKLLWYGKSYKDSTNS